MRTARSTIGENRMEAARALDYVERSAARPALGTVRRQRYHGVLRTISVSSYTMNNTNVVNNGRDGIFGLIPAPSPP